MQTNRFHKYEHFTEDRNFKTFLAESYALNSYYIFTNKILNMELNTMLIALMQFAYFIDIPEIYSAFNEYRAI